MLKVWGRRNSGNVQKVMWAIGEIGLAHQRIDVGGPFGGLDDPDFRALNPHGVIPVIDDGGTVVWESNAIVRYLCAEYSPDGLWPTSVRSRAAADQWMDWAATAWQPAFMGFFWSWYRTPPKLRDAAGNTQALERSYRCLAGLEAILAHRRFLAGDHFTMADIPAGAMLHRYFTLEIDRPDLPHVAAWYARLRERPAYGEHVMVPYDDLRGRLAF
jgi:glutathione S-transferase